MRREDSRASRSDVHQAGPPQAGEPTASRPRRVREIKLRPKVAQHDYETKRGHVERFLKQNDKVKVTTE